MQRPPGRQAPRHWFWSHHPYCQRGGGRWLNAELARVALASIAMIVIVKSLLMGSPLWWIPAAAALPSVIGGPGGRRFFTRRPRGVAVGHRQSVQTAG